MVFFFFFCFYLTVDSIESERRRSTTCSKGSGLELTCGHWGYVLRRYFLRSLLPQRRRPWLSHRLGSAAGSGSAWQPTPPTAPAARQLHKHTRNISLSSCYSSQHTNSYHCLTFLVYYHLISPAAPSWEQTCRRGPWVWADPASASPWSRSVHDPGRSGSASSSKSERTGPQKPPAEGARSACGLLACTCIRQKITLKF